MDNSLPSKADSRPGQPLAAEGVPGPAEAIPSPGRANRVYLLLVVLLLATGLLSSALPQARMAVLLLGEPLLAAVVLLAVRRENRPIRTALRWRWPGPVQVALGVAMGLGAYAVGGLIQIAVYAIFGEVPGVDVRRLAGNPGLLWAFLISAVVLAPLCEELIFRGYLLGIYEHYLSRWGSLVLVSLLFAILHMRLLGMFSLLPAAFLLTLLAMRSGSLAAGIAAHFSFNLAGMTLGLAMLRLPLLAVVAAAACLLVAAPVGAVVAWAAFGLRAPWPISPPRRPAAGTWLGHNWPLLVAGVIYLGFSGWEVVNISYPQLLAGKMPALKPPGWNQPVSQAYQEQFLFPGLARSEINCSLEPNSPEVVLKCSRFQPLTVLSPQSRLDWTVHWEAATLELRSASYAYRGAAGDWTATVERREDGTYRYQRRDAKGMNDEIELPVGVLIDGSWPWQLAGLATSGLPANGSNVQRATILRDGTVELSGRVLRDQGKEFIETATGTVSARRIQLGSDSAWYPDEPPRLPLKLTWEGVTYEGR